MNREATRRGEAVEIVATGILDQHLPTPDRTLAMIATLQRWAVEAETQSDEDSEENEQILRNLDEDRSSDRKLFEKILSEKQS